MKKMIALIAGMIFVPGMAFAALTGDCYDCHTMHNSEQGQPVAVTGSLTGVSTPQADPIPGLLKFDCLGCHANDPTGAATMTLATSTVPQVMSGQSLANSLAGGNFKFGEAGANRKVHNVVDLFAGQWEVYTVALSGPPGITRVDSTHAGKFGEVEQFDQFTCAGARGCHGTRSQLLTGATIDNGTDNNYVGTRRVGIAAVSGAHHWNTDGAKDDTGYNEVTSEADQIHDGQVVAKGYRFIPGLKGWETADWRNTNASHNEYFGVDAGMGSGCGACHMEGHDVDGNYGMGTRASLSSTMKTPNNSMSGFCASCHGNFHSAGTDPSGDQVNNGVSGAFLRHPSDYVIPDSGEYQYYTTWDVSAPVARPTVYGATSTTVTPGTDMVMCLSCHVPHGSEYDYLLRFDYSDLGSMTAGQAGDEATTSAAGGCLACHSAKGSDPADRTRTY